VQKPLYAGRILGFWTPEQEGTPFGPFVNRNHFAGWMLLALPLTLSLLAGGIAHAMRGIRPGWRHRVLWLSSPEANVLILLAAAVIVMSLALVMTMSRSGMTALALAIMLTGWFIVRAGGSRTRRATLWGYLLLLVVVTVGWAGTDAIVSRFSQTDWSEFDTRRGAWTDAWNIATTFPLAGTGLNTYGTATLFYQRHDLAQHYAQAHSDYLQLAAEGGLILVLPALAAIAFFVRDVRRRFREDEHGSTAWWVRGGAVTALLAMAFQESVDFSLQMPGNAALFAIVCAIALHQSRPARRTS
jgi:O-antigen ligase